MNATRRQIVVLSAWTMLALAPGVAPAQEKKDYPALGTIERKDPRIDRIIPSDAKVERLADGFDWSEGPAWDRKGAFLVFSDVPRNTVFRWKEGEGVSVYLKPSGYTGATPREIGRAHV